MNQTYGETEGNYVESSKTEHPIPVETVIPVELSPDQNPGATLLKESMISEELPSTDSLDTRGFVKNVEKLVSEREEKLKKVTKEREATLKAKNTRNTPGKEIQWQDNADGLDDELAAKSEGAYIDIATKIVDSATSQLDVQNKSKNNLKKTFTRFFIVLLSAQYLVLAALLFIRTFQHGSILTDTVIITYISSVFLETLGAVILMIRYAFDSEQETKVLEILNSIISRYQKFPRQ